MEPNTLLVHVSCARGLYLKNHNTIDAYASITLQGKGSTRSRVLTEQVQTSGDCKWDEHCEFKLTEKSTHILVVVQHKTRIGSSDLIGKCEITVEEARRLGGHTWFPLKKKKGDEKYRGEIQLQFTASYEKPSLSISNTDLSKIEKDGMLDRMKRKMHLGKQPKQAEDTLSIASGMSAMSVKSSRSHRFISKLKHMGGGGGMHKSTTLPHPSMRNAFAEEDSFHTAGNDSFDSPQFLTPQPHHGSINRLSSTFSRNDSSPALSIHTNNGHSLANGLAAAVSPSLSTAESFHRANSTRSAGSSGFGSSSKHNINMKCREAELGMSQGDLLAQVDSLRLELQVKESRMRDMQEYMDNLITRVMERCPEVLAAPVQPPKPKRRYF